MAWRLTSHILQVSDYFEVDQAYQLKRDWRDSVSLTSKDMRHLGMELGAVLSSNIHLINIVVTKRRHLAVTTREPNSCLQSHYSWAISDRQIITSLLNSTLSFASLV